MRRHFVLALGLLALATASPASAQSSAHIEEMTWLDVRDAMKAGKTTVIIPTGSMEDFGPHMPLSAHTALARHMAGEVAKVLGDALVAPVVPWVPNGEINPPSGHMRQSGSMTFPAPYFQSFITNVVRTYKFHGFTDIVLIGDHGGQQASLKAVADALNKEWAGTGTRVHFASEYYNSMRTFEEWLASQGEQKDAIGPQGGISHTSLMLVVRPDLVHKDRYLMKGYQRTQEDADPRRASEAYGRKGLEIRTTATVQQIRLLKAGKG